MVVVRRGMGSPGDGNGLGDGVVEEGADFDGFDEHAALGGWLVWEDR